MNPAVARRTALPWAAVAIAVLPLVVLAVRYVIGLRDESIVAGDYAVLEAGTRSALRFEQFVGPYSRYHWHQPGPLPFYWLAPFYGLSGQNLGGLGLGAVVLNLLCIAGIVIAVDRMAGRRAAWAAAVAVAAFSWSYGTEQFGEVWNPSMTVLPIALIVVLTAALVCGEAWPLPWTALAASFAVQTHVSTGVTVLVMVAVGAGALAWQRRHSIASLRWPLVGTALAVYVAWILPVFQQATQNPGNLGKLLSFFRTNTSAPHPLRAATGAVVRVLGTTDHNAGIFVRSTTIDVRTDVTEQVVTVVVLVAALAGLAALGVWRRHRFVTALTVLALVGVATCILAARQVFGDLLLYLLVFVAGVALAAVIALAVGLVDAVSHRAGERALTVVGLVLLALFTAFNVRDATQARLVSSREYSAVVAEALPPVLRAVDGIQGPVRIEIVTHEQWSLAGALLNELEQRGTDVTVQPAWTFIFGDERRSNGREPAVLAVASPGHAPPSPCVVAAKQAGFVISGSGEVCPGTSRL